MAMNQFFKTVGQTFKKASEKIDDTVEVQKIKYRILQKENEISEIHRSLGRTILEAGGHERVYATAISEAHRAILGIEQDLMALHAKRRVLEGKALCCHCACEVDGDADFCPKCGNKIEK